MRQNPCALFAIDGCGRRGTYYDSRSTRIMGVVSILIPGTSYQVRSTSSLMQYGGWWTFSVVGSHLAYLRGCKKYVPGILPMRRSIYIYIYTFFFFLIPGMIWSVQRAHQWRQQNFWNFLGYIYCSRLTCTWSTSTKYWCIYIDLAHFGGHARHILATLSPSQPVIANKEIICWFVGEHSRSSVRTCFAFSCLSSFLFTRFFVIFSQL